MNARVRIVVPAALVSLLALTAIPAAGSDSEKGESQLSKINHIVVIYEENHSFDNLYGSWEGVNGRANADAAHTLQVKQNGTAFGCLLQNDVNLASPPQLADCNDTKGTPANSPFSSHFANAPFAIDAFIPSSATTCPLPTVFAPHGVANGSGLPGGCTADIVHRYYQEQYQLDGGKQDRFTTGSDAAGLTQGYYATTMLPIYQFLHEGDHLHYAIADNFFEGAFGGSFLNHQWLVAAATPVFAGALNDGSSNDRHSVVDANGMPANSPLYASPLGNAVKDFNLTASCNPAANRPRTPAGVVCGDFAVNTTQPQFQPFSPNTPAARRLPALTTPNIGDELNSKGLDWAWYAGGWDNAAGNTSSPYYTNGPGPSCADPNTIVSTPPPPYPYCPDNLFQFHHQPFSYFAEFDPTTAAGRAARTAHLRDEKEFLKLASTSTEQQCNLKPVSFVKPIGEQNEHPGYASETAGSSHLVKLLKAIEGSACEKDTMVVATYDEFGGQWDHVTPPGQGGAAGPHDRWGPGTRIPALIIAPRLPGNFVVDSVQHDTTSILATIEHRFGLNPLGTRDAQVNDLASVYLARQVGAD